MPERFDELRVQPGEIADEAEAACDFVVHHGLREKALRIRGGDTDSGLAFGGDRGGELLVQKTGEDHDGDVARFAVGDAQPGNEFAFDGHALERGGEKTAAAMHDENFVAFTRERGDLARQALHQGVVFE